MDPTILSVETQKTHRLELFFVILNHLLRNGSTAQVFNQQKSKKTNTFEISTKL